MRVTLITKKTGLVFNVRVPYICGMSLHVSDLVFEGEIVQHFDKYAYLLSCRDLDEKIDAALVPLL